MQNIALTEWDLRPHLDAFLAKVRTHNELSCWPWTGAKNNHGQPKWQIQLAGERRLRQVYAHRCALFYFAGRLVKPDEDVFHTCNTKHCCNPNHLKVVPNPRGKNDRE
jgi:hypothetical protein